MVFHGLDTVSQIYINQRFIGRTDNMFIRYKFDIKPYLIPGINEILILFESAITYAKRVHDEYIRSNYVVPPGIDTTIYLINLFPNKNLLIRIDTI